MRKLDEIEKYFDEIEWSLSSLPVQLDPATMINDPKLFVEKTICMLRANPSKKVFKPYFDQLVRFYDLYKATKKIM